jgi:hypothetical protein
MFFTQTFVHNFFYTKILHKNCYIQKNNLHNFLDTNIIYKTVYTKKTLYTMCFYTNTFTHIFFTYKHSYKETLLPTKNSTHKHVLSTNAFIYKYFFTYKYFYPPKILHTDCFFIHKHFYI